METGAAGMGRGKDTVRRHLWRAVLQLMKPAHRTEFLTVLELLNETLFFGLDHARSAVSRWVADYNAARPHSALGYQKPAAYAADLTAMGETLRTTETLRVAPIASPAQTRITNHRTPAANG